MCFLGTEKHRVEHAKAKREGGLQRAMPRPMATRFASPFSDSVDGALYPGVLPARSKQTLKAQCERFAHSGYSGVRPADNVA